MATMTVITESPEWLDGQVTWHIRDLIFWINKGYKLTEKQMAQYRELKNLLEKTDGS